MTDMKNLPFKNHMSFPDCVVDIRMEGYGEKGAVKEKLKNILKYRLCGTDGPLQDIISCKGKDFDADPIWLDREVIPGWDYYHLEGLSGDYLEYEDQLFRWNGCECHAALWLELFASGAYYDFLANDRLTKEDVDMSLGDILFTCCLDNDTEPPEEDIVEDIYGALLAIRNGKAEENPEISAFIDGLSSAFGDVFSFGMILKNLELFTDCLSSSTEDTPIRATAVSSSEVFQYKKYRENVPEKIRRNFDNALKIFYNPLPGNMFTIMEDNEEKGVTAVGFMLMDGYYDFDGCSYGCSSQDMHPLYTEAVRFLIDNLPVLRKEFGDATASPVLFLCLFLLRFLFG